MRRKYNRRRTSVPQDRFKRAVAYRHRSFTSMHKKSSNSADAQISEKIEEQENHVETPLLQESAENSSVNFNNILEKISGFFKRVINSLKKENKSTDNYEISEASVSSDNLMDHSNAEREFRAVKAPISHVNRKKRKTIPQDRLTHSVTARHRRYKPDIPFVLDKNTDVVQSEESVIHKENVNEQDNTSFTAGLEPVEDNDSLILKNEPETVNEPEDSENTRLSLREKRNLRKKKKDDELERIIDEPHAGFFRALFDPVGAVEIVAKNDLPTVNIIWASLSHLLKWIMFMANPAVILYEFINANAYGFARLSYNQAANLAIIYGLYIFAAEFVTFFIVELTCSSLRKHVSHSRILAITAYTQPIEIILFAASAYLYTRNPLYGFAMFMAVSVFSLYLKTYALYKAADTRRRLFVTLLICTVIFTCLGIKVVSLTSTDVLKILQNIMNI